MKTFIWVAVIMFALDCLAKVIILSSAREPEPSKKSDIAVDLIFNACILIWACILIAEAP